MQAQFYLGLTLDPPSVCICFLFLSVCICYACVLHIFVHNKQIELNAKKKVPDIFFIFCCCWRCFYASVANAAVLLA